jgi:hypothetical protein
MLKVGALQPLINVVKSGQDTMLVLALTLFKTFATDGTGASPYSGLVVCLTLYLSSPNTQGVGKSDVRDSPTADSRAQAAQAAHSDHAVGADPGVKR